MSDPNSVLRTGLGLPENFARPRWSRFPGVCYKAWKKLSALLMQSEGQVNALQQVRGAAVVLSSPRMGV